MSRHLLAILLVIASPGVWAQGSQELDGAITEAATANRQLQNPNLTPEQRDQVVQQKATAVQKVETIANRKADDPGIQLKASKGLASADEAPRAIPYAERGLTLAEKKGDPKLIRDALLTGSEVYYKAGRYDLAKERAQRVLKENPKDKDALALYMLVKDRGSSSASSPAAGPSPAAASGGGSTPPPAGQAAAARPAPPPVAMTSAASLESQRLMAEGRRTMLLDTKASLKFFDAAVAADPRKALPLAVRSDARRKAGDLKGARADADLAVALEPNFGPAYAARAMADRALGAPDSLIVKDYEQAAKLDAQFADEYRDLVTKLAGGASSSGAAGGSGSSAGRSAPGAMAGPLGLLSSPPKGWGLIAGLMALLAAIAGIAAAFFLGKKRSVVGAHTPQPGPTPTPRP